MTDAGAFPPEVNSGLVHGGAGPTTTESSALAFAAAAAQDEVSAQTLLGILEAARASWTGAAADQATAGLQPLIAWFQELAIHGTASAEQVQAAASSIATAIAGAPYPAVVTDNRVVWAGLWNTNFFGFNTPAIAVQDAHYLEMWLQAAFARATSDVEAAVATGSLVPWVPPPIPVNLAALGVPTAHAASMWSAVPASVMDAAQRAEAGAGMSALLVEAGAGDVAHAAQQRPNTALLASAADGSSDTQQQDTAKNNPLSEVGSQQASGMAGQMGGLVSSAGQLPASVGGQLSQPLQAAFQPAQQFSSFLQPLMSSGGLGNPGAGLGGADAAGQFTPAPFGFATGGGNLAAALTRPAGGFGGGAGVSSAALRLPASSMAASAPPAAAEPAAARAIAAAGPGATAAGGSGMYGAPMHPHSAGRQGGGENKYADSVQIGPPAESVAS